MRYCPRCSLGSWWLRSLDFFGSFLELGFDPWGFFSLFLDHDGYDPWNFLDFFGSFPDLGFDPWDFFDSWVRSLGFLWFMGTTLGISLVHSLILMTSILGFLWFIPWSWWVRPLGFLWWPLGFLGFPWSWVRSLGFLCSWVRPLGFLGLMIYFQFGHDVFSTWKVSIVHSLILMASILGFLWFIPWSWWVRSLRIQDQGTSPLLRRQERSNKSNF